MIEQTAPYWSLIVMGIVIFVMSQFLRSGAHTGEQPPKDADKDIPRLPEKAGTSLPATVTLTVPAGGVDVFAGLPLAVLTEETLADVGGMKPAGDFTVGEFPGLSIRTYTHPEKSLVGILYRDGGGRAWLNLLTEYADGRVITTSSAPEELVTRDRPNGMPLFNHPGFDPQQLLRRHKLSIRTMELKTAVTPDGLPAFFAEVYGRLRDHMEANAKVEANKGFFGVRISFPTPLGGSEPAENDASPADPSPAVLRKWLDEAYRAANVPLEKRSEFMEQLVWVMEGAQMEAIARTISRYSTVSVIKAVNRWNIRDDSGAQTPFDPESLTGPALFDKINSILPEPARFHRLDTEIKNVIFYARGDL
jgi:hypothetical protein